MTNIYPSAPFPPARRLSALPWQPTIMQIDTACAWWSQALSHHRFDTVGHNSAKGIWLACLASERFRHPPQEIVQAYIQALRVTLERAPTRRLIVDYRPEGVLLEALEVADLPKHWKLPTGLQFPRKTCMEFGLDGKTWIYYQSDTHPLLVG